MPSTQTTEKPNKKLNGASKRGSQRARTRARARRGAKAPMKTIELKLSEVIVDEAWNSRSVELMGTGKPTSGEPESPEHDLTDEQLRASIGDKGILQPCGVREVDGSYHLVWGFRRLRAAVLELGPDHVTRFVLKDKHKDALVDEYEALSLNLQENMQRKNLRPFEIAMTIYRMKKTHPNITVKELAKDVGVSYTYASNLIRIPTKACPQLLDIFKTYGTQFGNGITYKDFVSIVSHPKDEQMMHWKALVDERTGKASSGKGASSSSSSKQPNLNTLQGFLMNIDKVKGPPEFKSGLAYGLQIAIGEKKLSLSYYDQQQRKKKTKKKRTTKKAATKKKTSVKKRSTKKRSTKKATTRKRRTR